MFPIPKTADRVTQAPGSLLDLLKIETFDFDKS